MFGRKGDAGIALLIFLIIGGLLASQYPFGATGRPCTTDANCYSGEYCYNGWCYTCKLENDYCTSNNMCCSGTCTNNACTSGGCQPNGAYCSHYYSSDSSCCSGYCGNYVCANQGNNQCSVDSDCCSIVGYGNTPYVDCFWSDLNQAYRCRADSTSRTGYYYCGGTTTTTKTTSPTTSPTTTTISGIVCTYNGKQYSVGAIISVDCTGGFYEVCTEDGFVHGCNIWSDKYTQYCIKERQDVAKQQCSGLCKAQGQSCNPLLPPWCCSGLICKNGFCQYEDIACGDLGDPCEDQNDCCVGTFCNPFLWYKTCQEGGTTRCEDWCDDPSAMVDGKPIRYCHLERCNQCSFCQDVPTTKCVYNDVTYQTGDVISKDCNIGYWYECGYDGAIHGVTKQGNPEKFKILCPDTDCRIQGESCGLTQSCCQGMVCEPPSGGTCQIEGSQCLAEGRNCELGSIPCCANLKCSPYMTWYTCQKEVECEGTDIICWLKKYLGANWWIYTGIALIILFAILFRPRSPHITVMPQVSQ